MDESWPSLLQCLLHKSKCSVEFDYRSPKHWGCGELKLLEKIVQFVVISEQESAEGKRHIISDPQLHSLSVRAVNTSLLACIIH